MTNEFETAVMLSNRVLDDQRNDPDDDLAVLARQFQRAVEREQIILARGMATNELAIRGFEMLVAMLESMGTVVPLKKMESARSALDSVKRNRDFFTTVRRQKP